MITIKLLLMNPYLNEMHVSLLFLESFKETRLNLFRGSITVL